MEQTHIVIVIRRALLVTFLRLLGTFLLLVLLTVLAVLAMMIHGDLLLGVRISRCDGVRHLGYDRRGKWRNGGIASGESSMGGMGLDLWEGHVTLSFILVARREDYGGDPGCRDDGESDSNMSDDNHDEGSVEREKGSV